MTNGKKACHSSKGESLLGRQRQNETGLIRARVGTPLPCGADFPVRCAEGLDMENKLKEERGSRLELDVLKVHAQ